MAARKQRAPATSLAARENQLVALAFKAAEKKLQDGSASSPMIIHYLKLGSTLNELEKEKLRVENDLLLAKIESLKSDRGIEAMFAEAISAFRTYQGVQESYDIGDDDD